MSDYFVENKNFWSLNGILGRRDFIINFLIIEVVEALILTTPIIYMFFLKPDILSQFTISSVPLWWTIWALVVSLIEGVLIFPSIVRRVRDIIGEEDENRINLISALLVVFCYVVVVALAPKLPIMAWLAIAVYIFLMVMEGKITSQKPKSEIIKYNWGAFLGTWIWGLFNKTPITLLVLPLLLTTGWFPFMLLCGLKGNEWAFNNDNEKYTSVEDFHERQSGQAIGWAIAAPFVYVIGFIVFLVGTSIGVGAYLDKNPDALERLNSWSQNLMHSNVEATFSKIDLDGEEYKFYIQPDAYSAVKSDEYKKAMFKSAVNYVADKKDVSIIPQFKKTGEKYKHFENFVDLASKTKIYSTFNNEVLMEYSIDLDEFNSELQKKEYEDVVEEMDEGYIINEHPTLP